MRTRKDCHDSFTAILVFVLHALRLPPAFSFSLQPAVPSPQLPTLQHQSFSSTALACQLLGMNCASPTEFALSWPGFCERGGQTDIHADGWGLAYYEGKSQGLRQFHDVEAASTSPLAQFLGQQPIQTRNMLAHIRYATAGEVDLANVHPFAREMWGIQWCFCHNGEIPLFVDHPDHRLGKKGDPVYHAIGTTDSEAAFCALLNALRAEFTDNMPSLPVLYESLQRLCQEIVDYDPQSTIFNFLLACGPHVLWVYSWPGKRPGSKVWNGLHYTVSAQSTSLCDSDFSIDLCMVDDEEEQVCIVATSPLTSDDEWIELQKGELILLDQGLPRVSVADMFRVELQGHGLHHKNGKVLPPPRLEEDMRRYHFEPSFFAAGGI